MVIYIGWLLISIAFKLSHQITHVKEEGCWLDLELLLEEASFLNNLLMLGFTCDRKDIDGPFELRHQTLHIWKEEGHRLVNAFKI